MYLGLVTVTLGIAVWVGSWPMFVAPIAVFATANFVHIPYEEAKMRRQYGAAYDDYVRRGASAIRYRPLEPANAARAARSHGNAQASHARPPRSGFLKFEPYQAALSSL